MSIDLKNAASCLDGYDLDEIDFSEITAQLENTVKALPEAQQQIIKRFLSSIEESQAEGSVDNLINKAHEQLPVPVLESLQDGLIENGELMNKLQDICLKIILG